MPVINCLSIHLLSYLSFLSGLISMICILFAPKFSNALLFSEENTI